MEQEKVLPLPVELSFFMQTAVFGSLSVVSFFTPFLLGHPQWLVGTVVNLCLFMAAIFAPACRQAGKKYFLPIVVLPSLGVVARGLVFGPFTPFLAYFLPFIWLGNLVLILAFKKAFDYKAKHADMLFGAGVFGASALKFLVLFLVASFYIKFNFAPAMFLQAMGLNQLATALAGGLISYLIWKTYLLRQKN